MKKRYLHSATLLMSLLALLLVASCQQDSSGDDSRKKGSRKISMVLGQHTYSGILVQGNRAARRALPDNFVVYKDLLPQMAMEDTQVRAYVTHDKTELFSGDFIYEMLGDEYVWSAQVPIDDGDFYIYGFMPSSAINSVKIDPLDYSYSKGAQLHITDIPAVTPYDPCVIVGVKGNENATDPIANVGVKWGNFKYNAGSEGEFLYLLLDHLYSALEFRLNIDEQYSKLRKIKVKQVTLKPLNVSKSQLTVELRHNDTGTNPMSDPVFEQTSGVGEPQVIYKPITPEYLPVAVSSSSQTTAYDVRTVNFMACLAPVPDNTDFIMTTTYEVYDRYDNLLRQDETENKLTIPVLGAGEKSIIYMTVKPTYLYVLGDPDLDNPIFTVN